MKFINGSDILFTFGGKAVGGCTTHTTTFTTETKETVTKPVPTAAASAGLFGSKRVTKKRIQVQFEGLRASDETQGGFKSFLDMWKKGESVECEFFDRGYDENPYMVGKFLLTNLVETSPAGDDATYSGTLENDGEPTTLDASKLAGETITNAAG